MRPLGNRVAIKVDKPEEMTKSGLFIPSTAQHKPQQGKVVAVGPGKYVKGFLVPPSVKTGDIVLFAQWTGTELKVDGEKVLLMNEDDLLAVMS